MQNSKCEVGFVSHQQWSWFHAVPFQLKLAPAKFVQVIHLWIKMSAKCLKCACVPPVLRKSSAYVHYYQSVTSEWVGVLICVKRHSGSSYKTDVLKILICVSNVHGCSVRWFRSAESHPEVKDILPGILETQQVEAHSVHLCLYATMSVPNIVKQKRDKQQGQFELIWINLCDITCMLFWPFLVICCILMFSSCCLLRPHCRPVVLKTSFNFEMNMLYVGKISNKFADVIVLTFYITKIQLGSS